jgi:hypothetical protein
VDPDRLTFSWVSASEGLKWRDIVNDAVARVKKLGPFQEYQSLSRLDEQFEGEFTSEEPAMAGRQE